MIEHVHNILQMVIIASTAVLCMKAHDNSNDKMKYKFIILSLFCVLMADLVYELYLLIAGEFPANFSAADLSYIGFFLLVAILIIHMLDNETKRDESTKLAIIKNKKYAILASFAMLLLYVVMMWIMIYWEYTVISYILYLAPAMFVAYYCTLGTLVLKKYKPLMFVLSAIIFSSCMMSLFSTMGINFGYYFFDVVFSLLFAFVYPALKRGDIYD